MAVELARRLWRPAQPPFRPVNAGVTRGSIEPNATGSELAALARELLRELGGAADWVVHGDFHHHNILRHGDRYVAIDPKPYLADREYDVPAFLWNPIGNRLDRSRAARAPHRRLRRGRPERLPDPRLDGDQGRLSAARARRSNPLATSAYL